MHKCTKCSQPMQPITKKVGSEYYLLIYYCPTCNKGVTANCPKCNTKLHYGMDPVEEGDYVSCPSCSFHESFSITTESVVDKFARGGYK